MTTNLNQQIYTGNPQPGKPFLYRISLFTIQYIQFVFRYSLDTKTLIPKNGIIFSKPLKIGKSTKNNKSYPKNKFRGAALNAAHN
jgi:hypothetical protein